ncbi:MAG: MATE family efflux transporter, partial [Bacillota bacterium]|nr:MATE family efflux transporter [Bacillota bacterium]
PAILAMMIQAMYNIVDSYFVSQIGEEALAAVTYIFPLQFIMIAFSIGTGIGINSLIARRLGAKKLEEANSAACHGYRLSIFNWLVFAIVGFFFARPLMEFMTDTTYIVEEGTSYMTIVMVGSLFLFVELISEKILQATGNMIFPMLCGLLGAVVNVVLDPILIFGIGPFPEMGVSGAAVATVIGQFFGFVLGQYLLFGKNHQVKVKLTGWKWHWETVRDIYAVGFPAILMQCIGSVTQFGMNMILGSMTETAVAVMGVFGRLQSFIFMPVFGLNQGILPILGYNYGAKNKARLMATYKRGFIIAFIYMSLGLIVFEIFAHGLIGAFNAQNNQDMFEIGVNALRILSICFVPASYGIMTTSVFQATGHGFLSLWSPLIRQLICVLPLAYILGKFMGLDAVWFSYPLAETMGTAYVITAFVILYNKELKHLGEERISR